MLNYSIIKYVEQQAEIKIYNFHIAKHFNILYPRCF